MDPDTPRHHLCLSQGSPHREATGCGPMPSSVAGRQGRSGLGDPFALRVPGRSVSSAGLTVAVSITTDESLYRHARVPTTSVARVRWVGSLGAVWWTDQDPTADARTTPKRGSGQFWAARQNRVPPVFIFSITVLPDSQCSAAVVLLAVLKVCSGSVEPQSENRLHDTRHPKQLRSFPSAPSSTCRTPLTEIPSARPSRR